MRRLIQMGLRRLPFTWWNRSQAVIERLTVGSKSTTWVRFLEGPFKDFARFERSEIGWLSFPFLSYIINTVQLLTTRWIWTIGSETAPYSLASRTLTSGLILQLSRSTSLSKLMARKWRKRMLPSYSMKQDWRKRTTSLLRAFWIGAK